MSFSLLPTAFHPRTAEHNLSNAWVQRGAFTVPAYYGEARQEALAARFSAVLIDATPYEDLRVHGEGAAALLSAACGLAVKDIDIGGSLAVHWCADGGGLRGLGALCRLGESSFLLRSSDADLGWFAQAAPRFDAVVRDATRERGLVVLVGPFAAAVLDATGFEDAAQLEVGQLQVHEWRGLGVTILRDPQLGAYHVSCTSDDGPLLFDRLLHAGKPLGLRLAGQEAFELLQLEAGIAFPHIDFAPARENFAREPLPSSLGLAPALGAQPQSAARVLAGVIFDREEPCAFAPLYRGHSEVGQTLRSAYSLVLRRAIALAQLVPADGVPGTELTVRKANSEGVRARVVTLPFL